MEVFMDNRVDNRLCEVGFGTAGAVVSFLSVLVLGILAALGVLAYLGFHNEAFALTNYHPLFTLTPVGVIIASIVAGIHGFVVGYLFAVVYNHCPVHSNKK
jgi:tellurite resistance protein TehA-like permease